MKVVPNKLGREEFVSNMVPYSRLAATRDAKAEQEGKREFVSSTVPRRRLAVMKDVLTNLSEKESALGMGQRCRSRGRLDQKRGTGTNKKERR